jgi:hypothetical protein
LFLAGLLLLGGIGAEAGTLIVASVDYQASGRITRGRVATVLQAVGLFAGATPFALPTRWARTGRRLEAALLYMSAAHPRASMMEHPVIGEGDWLGIRRLGGKQAGLEQGVDLQSIDLLLQLATETLFYVSQS